MRDCMIFFSSDILTPPPPAPLPTLRCDDLISCTYTQYNNLDNKSIKLHFI